LRLLEGVLAPAGICRVVIAGGETEADLQVTAEQAARTGRSYIAAGTGAFVRAWARTLDVARRRARPRCIARSGLIIAGSRHPQSRLQVGEAKKRGIPRFGTQDDPERIASAVQRHGWVIVSTSDGVCADPWRVAAECGSAVREIAARAQPEALVVFGGETASAVLDALGCTLANPIRELLPGVPVSRLGDDRSTVLVTKAGGFGDKDVIEQILKRLESC
jgi:uncharacterized protein YgbK (DUF1537 family)